MFCKRQGSLRSKIHPLVPQRRLVLREFAKNVSSGDRLQAVSLSAQGYSRQTNKRASEREVTLHIET